MESGRKVRRGKTLTFSCPFAAKSEEEQEQMSCKADLYIYITLTRIYK